MGARGKSAKMVKINGVKLRGLIEDKGFSMKQLSTGLLGMSDAVIGTSVRNNSIEKSHLEKICFIFNENVDDYIVKEEVKPDVKVPDNPAPSVSDNSEIVKALNTLIALQTEQNKKLDILQASITALTEGQKKMQEHLDIDLDSIDDGLSKVNSAMNVVNGRLRDICNHEQKTATKLKAVKSM